MDKQTLEQAIALYKAGNKNEARNLLALLLKEQPKNETAWLWMSACVEEESQKAFCLRKVLEINPNNPNAVLGLETFSKKTVEEKAPIPDNQSVNEKPQERSQQNPQENHSATRIKKAEVSKKSPDRQVLLLGGIGIAIVLVVIVIFVLLLSKNNGSLAAQVNPSPNANSATLSATIKPTTVDIIVIETKAAKDAIAQLTANAPTITFTPMDSPTPADSPTPTLSPTPRPTSTPLPTPTPEPGLGDSVNCGNLWQISVDEPPVFQGVFTDKAPKGTYVKVKFKLTNLQNTTASLNPFMDNLNMIGELYGSSITFKSTLYGPSINEQNEGIAAWNDDMPPQIQVSTLAIFDVNPNAKNWQLSLSVDSSDAKCSVVISLY